MIDEILRFVLSLFKKVASLLQSFMQSFSKSSTKNKIIEFDTGLRAKIEHQIAEGGFSYIYSAHDATSPNIKYALKRIICPDEETLVSCRAEAKVHRMLDHHINIMKLLGVKFDSSGGGSGGARDRVCYMLFPLITGGSLRDEITNRRLLHHEVAMTPSHCRCMTTVNILNLFLGVLKGVKAMHDVGYAHCDIKLENIMLNKSSSSYKDEEMGSGRNSSDNIATPILMDFGSARKLVVRLTDRRTVLNLTEEASQNSTVSYRAPELFDGGCRHGPDEPDVDGKVDVWSCGCVLYGLMYGTSPFEMEFRQDGSIRIVECTHLRVLSGIVPLPPKSREAAYGYRKELIDLVQWMLIVDRKKRPDLDSVMERVDIILPLCEGQMASFDGIVRRAIV